MKTHEHERRYSKYIIILILLLGFFCIILASGWAIRFAPSWKLDTNMGSNLNPTSGFLTSQPIGLFEPIDPAILTNPVWIDGFLTPGISFPMRTAQPTGTSTLTPVPLNTNTPIPTGNRPTKDRLADAQWSTCYFGTPTAIRGAIGSTWPRENRWLMPCARVSSAGLENPYLVVLSMTVELAVRYAEAMGIDAIGAYANWSYGSYLDLAARNRRFWDECKSTDRQMVPLVNAGWDPRPRYATEHARMYGEVRDWAEQPTPAELAGHLQSALEWVDRNPGSCEPGTVMVYAWNETDEGSWLAPTLSEGPARLEAIRVMRTKCGK